ncbi:MAG: hypothetical protein JWQ33_2408 [Ramlibacter sp.]|nr:hypothetical protein [Ramlibacter sp.]
MKIVPFVDGDWINDHPLGSILFKHLLKGDAESPDNFMYILGRQDGDFLMPRHRHNFDQIRLPLRGDMNIGRGITLREGEVGYFAEGLAYGPQDDPLGSAKPGERLQLVLQFGGASAYGFMSIEQRRQARDELAKLGHFDGPYYVRADGKKEWGLNTIWEHVFGSKLKYPRSRYKDVVIADPASFNWLPVHGAHGVARKFMGAFSERGVSIEMTRIAPAASWSSAHQAGRRLIVVLSGSGIAAGQPASYLTAIQAEAGERLDINASDEMVLFVIGLPTVEVPEVESAAYESDALGSEPIQPPH